MRASTLSFCSAVCLGIVGMAIGIAMAASGDHSVFPGARASKSARVGLALPDRHLLPAPFGARYEPDRSYPIGHLDLRDNRPDLRSWGDLSRPTRTGASCYHWFPNGAG